MILSKEVGRVLSSHCTSASAARDASCAASWPLPSSWLAHAVRPRSYLHDRFPGRTDSISNYSSGSWYLRPDPAAPRSERPCGTLRSLICVERWQAKTTHRLCLLALILGVELNPCRTFWIQYATFRIEMRAGGSALRRLPATRRLAYFGRAVYRRVPFEGDRMTLEQFRDSLYSR